MKPTQILGRYAPGSSTSAAPGGYALEAVYSSASWRDALKTLRIVSLSGFESVEGESSRISDATFHPYNAVHTMLIKERSLSTVYPWYFSSGSINTSNWGSKPFRLLLNNEREVPAFKFEKKIQNKCGDVVKE